MGPIGPAGQSFRGYLEPLFERGTGGLEAKKIDRTQRWN